MGKSPSKWIDFNGFAVLTTVDHTGPEFRQYVKLLFASIMGLKVFTFFCFEKCQNARLLVVSAAVSVRVDCLLVLFASPVFGHMECKMRFHSCSEPERSPLVHRQREGQQWEMMMIITKCDVVLNINVDIDMA